MQRLRPLGQIRALYGTLCSLGFSDRTIRTSGTLQWRANARFVSQDNDSVFSDTIYAATKQVSLRSDLRGSASVPCSEVKRDARHVLQPPCAQEEGLRQRSCGPACARQCHGDGQCNLGSRTCEGLSRRRVRRHHVLERKSGRGARSWRGLRRTRRRRKSRREPLRASRRCSHARGRPLSPRTERPRSAPVKQLQY